MKNITKTAQSLKRKKVIIPFRIEKELYESVKKKKNKLNPTITWEELLTVSFNQFLKEG